MDFSARATRERRFTHSAFSLPEGGALRKVPGMYAISNIADLPFDPALGSAVTIGNFDGVHLGHRRLIERTVQAAKNMNLRAVIITFEPHPLRVLLGDNAPCLLMPPRRKLALLSALGADVVLALPFSRETAELSPEAFVRRTLVEGLGVRHLTVGYDYAFGKGRRGNAALLGKLGNDFGFSVEELGPIEAGGGIVSSTRIRTAIADGRVEEAAQLLGRPHGVEGIVAHGRSRGRTLGFPTANLHIGEDLLLPRTGVYAVRAELCAPGVPVPEVIDGVANVGSNPTFADEGLRVESHLFDFNRDIYGGFLRVNFLARLREEVVFAGLEELKEQIRRDAETARALLANLPPTIPGDCP